MFHVMYVLIHVLYVLCVKILDAYLHYTTRTIATGTLFLLITFLSSIQTQITDTSPVKRCSHDSEFLLLLCAEGSPALVTDAQLANVGHQMPIGHRCHVNGLNSDVNHLPKHSHANQALVVR